jgi:uncharacterized protein (TIGR02284 family)
MTTISKESIEVLNDLVKINNDRIEGYTKAAEDIKNEDFALQPVFNRMANESRQYVSDLNSYIHEMGGEAGEGTTTAGKLYRAWMDVKATFTGRDRTSVLSSCEYGEDQAQKAYNEALSNIELDSETRELLSGQKLALKESHDLIKQLRDARK